MSEKKNMTGKENSFHMENFRRRSRYAAVFLVLILAFAAITVLNINSGNVNISIPEIFRILLRRTGEGKEYNIIWKIRLPRILMAAILGGALAVVLGFLLIPVLSPHHSSEQKMAGKVALNEGKQ